jgi:hypothetical protein
MVRSGVLAQGMVLRRRLEQILGSFRNERQLINSDRRYSQEGKVDATRKVASCPKLSPCCLRVDLDIRQPTSR